MITFAVNKSSHGYTLTFFSHLLRCIALSILLLSLVTSAQAAARMRRTHSNTDKNQGPLGTPGISAGSLTALKTLSAIILDGNLNESVWNQANFVTFYNPLRSDNTLKISVLWDDANLYFGYDVTDAQLEALNDINSLYFDDGAEIYIDAQNNKSKSWDGNDYVFLANINDLTNSSSIGAKTLTKSGGYTMEIVIPWSAISTVPGAGKVLGLLLATNDRDFGKSFQFDWLGLINSGAYARPYLWGNLTLSATTVGSSAEVASNSGLRGTTTFMILGGVIPSGMNTGWPTARPTSMEFATVPVEHDGPRFETATFVKSDGEGKYEVALSPGKYWVGPKAKAIDPLNYNPGTVSFPEQVIVVKEGAYTQLDLQVIGYAP
jgi:cellulose/xylan binding protein with CBM9 domain